MPASSQNTRFRPSTSLFRRHLPACCEFYCLFTHPSNILSDQFWFFPDPHVQQSAGGCQRMCDTVVGRNEIDHLWLKSWEKHFRSCQLFGMNCGPACKEGTLCQNISKSIVFCCHFHIYTFYYCLSHAPLWLRQLIAYFKSNVPEHTNR